VLGVFGVGVRSLSLDFSALVSPVRTGDFH